MKKYLLVEGITDIAFVKYVCLQNNITSTFNGFKQVKNEYSFEDLIIINMDGQSNLKRELSFLKAQEIKIEKIAIIEDADDDFKASSLIIKLAIKESLIKPSKIEYFLTPNNKDRGDLETLLLSTIQDSPIIKCFDDYKVCLQDKQEIYEKALNKGQVYAYTMYSQKGQNLHKPQDSFISKKNEDTGLWDLRKSEFNPIVTFIVDFFRT